MSRVQPPPPALSDSRVTLFTKLKTAERDEARRLRETSGAPIKEIALLLGVSKSSVSAWVRGIELTREQHAALRERNPTFNAQLNGSAAKRRTSADAAT